MKTIILATDFSAAASNAAMYASDMALAIHIDLYLLHVYQIPVVYLEIPVALAADDIQDDAERKMKKLREELLLRTKSQIQIETAVEEGNFFEELKTTCEYKQPYAVVLGSQGRTAAEHLMYGTHAVHIMKYLEWPVITVPHNAKFASIKRIGLACDLDDVLGTVPVEEIKVLVNDFNAELHVLNIGKKDEYNPEVLEQSALLQRMLGKIIPFYHFITDSNTDKGIMQFAEANNIDLLIVLPKHRSLIDKLIHRSHTKQLVLHSHVPVVAFHHHFIKSSEVV
jgi:nucleotide-binding universal stress UspA family protein